MAVGIFKATRWRRMRSTMAVGAAAFIAALPLPTLSRCGRTPRVSGARLAPRAAPRRRWEAPVRHRVEPRAKLCVEILQITKCAAEEKILTNVAIRSLDFALGLGAISCAGSGCEAIVLGQSLQAGVVDDPLAHLVQDRGLH